MKQPLIILAGPTASGKTSLSVELAKRFHMEIISADSMQVYRRMDIGTAKVTKEEMQNVPHHLVDILEPWEEWNVMAFCERAKEAIQEISSRGHIPLLVGGTGFYIHALAYGAEFEEEPKEQEEIRRQLEALSTEALWEKLQDLDPSSTQKIHPNNRKRVIRAIEYALLNGRPISELNERLRQKESPYDLLYLVLDLDRQVLYDRINRRVDQMMEDGLVEEVRSLAQAGCTKDMVSMKGLGYKEIMDYLDGTYTLDDAVYVLKRDTRHFAKRQITWMQHEKDVVYVPAMPYETLQERAGGLVEAFLQEHDANGVTSLSHEG